MSYCGAKKVSFNRILELFRKLKKYTDTYKSCSYDTFKSDLRRFALSNVPVNAEGSATSLPAITASSLPSRTYSYQGVARAETSPVLAVPPMNHTWLDSQLNGVAPDKKKEHLQGLSEDLKKERGSILARFKMLKALAFIIEQRNQAVNAALTELESQESQEVIPPMDEISDIEEDEPVAK